MYRRLEAALPLERRVEADKGGKQRPDKGERLGAPAAQVAQQQVALEPAFGLPERAVDEQTNPVDALFARARLDELGDLRFGRRRLARERHQRVAQRGRRLVAGGRVGAKIRTELAPVTLERRLGALQRGPALPRVVELLRARKRALRLVEKAREARQERLVTRKAHAQLDGARRRKGVAGRV